MDGWLDRWGLLDESNLAESERDRPCREVAFLVWFGHLCGCVSLFSWFCIFLVGFILVATTGYPSAACCNRWRRGVRPTERMRSAVCT